MRMSLYILITYSFGIKIISHQVSSRVGWGGVGGGGAKVRRSVVC